MNLNRAVGFVILLFSTFFSAIIFADSDDRASLTPKIINGESVTDGRYDFVVYIESFDFETGQGGSCSGSFIHPQYIITAAHCLELSSSFSFSAEDVSVLYNIEGLLPLADATIKGASEIFIHPDYTADNLENDIAIIKLESPAVQDDLKGDVEVTPVILPERENIFQVESGAPVYIAGWGLTSNESNATPNDLQVGLLTFLGPEFCEFAYGDDAFNRELSLCANESEFADDNAEGEISALQDVSSVCSGDSGGPLFSTDGDGNAYLLGITSAGPAVCGAAIGPDIFTSACVYLPFISSAMGDDYNYTNQQCPLYPYDQAVLDFEESNLTEEPPSADESEETLLGTANGSFSLYLILLLVGVILFNGRKKLIPKRG